MEKFHDYEFEIRSHEVPGYGADIDKWVKGYFYVIYDSRFAPSEETIIVESNEYFESQLKAQFAAIGHISLLEKRNGSHD